MHALFEVIVVDGVRDVPETRSFVTETTAV